MKRLLFPATALFIILIFSCNKYDASGRLIKDYDELEKTRWLLGEWVKSDSLGTLKEIWTVKDDSTFYGESYYIINEKDTVHNEKIDLVEDNEHLIYYATVKGQNNDEPVPFQMTIDEDSLVVFENPKHDYPTKFSYKLLPNQSVKITVTGKEHGKSTSEVYELKKVK